MPAGGEETLPGPTAEVATERSCVKLAVTVLFAVERSVWGSVAAERPSPAVEHGLGPGAADRVASVPLG